MKFRISTAGNYYTEEEFRKLSKLGIGFKKTKLSCDPKAPFEYERKEFGQVEMKDIRELADFVLEYGEVVVTPPWNGHEDTNGWTIQIYDDYRE